MNYDFERLESRRRRRQKKVYVRINMDRYFFRERFRMNMEEFGHVLNVLGPILAHPTFRSIALTPEQQILLALRFLGTGGSLHLIGDAHGVSKASVSRCTHRVVNAINSNFFR